MLLQTSSQRSTCSQYIDYRRSHPFPIRYDITGVWWCSARRPLALQNDNDTLLTRPRQRFSIHAPPFIPRLLDPYLLTVLDQSHIFSNIDYRGMIDSLSYWSRPSTSSSASIRLASWGAPVDVLHHEPPTSIHYSPLYPGHQTDPNLYSPLRPRVTVKHVDECSCRRKHSIKMTIYRTQVLLSSMCPREFLRTSSKGNRCTRRKFWDNQTNIIGILLGRIMWRGNNLCRRQVTATVRRPSLIFPY
jgi:hypothetical protein